MHKNRFQVIFEEFMTAAKLLQTKNPKEISIPSLNLSSIIDICKSVIPEIKEDQPVPAITSPCVVVGDLHGHVYDLLRILDKFGKPEKIKYIFLGDYVDRGEFQIETVILLFLMKILFPHNVTLIRGNHESMNVKVRISLLYEIQKMQIPNDIIKYFTEAFNELPPACLFDGKTFCVHGGIGPTSTLQALREIVYPIHTSPIIDDLIWSDPDESVAKFSASPRGNGCLYGEKAVKEFLEANDFSRIIRSHTFIKEGHTEFFNGKVLSIFSASNYCGKEKNNSCVLFFKSSEEYKYETFSPLEYVPKEFAAAPKINKQPTATTDNLRKSAVRTFQPIRRYKSSTVDMLNESGKRQQFMNFIFKKAHGNPSSAH